MDKSRSRTVIVLYVILFILSVVWVSVIQIGLNQSTAYALDIEYEIHTVDASGLVMDHSYETIRVQLSVMTSSYQSTLGGIRVGSFSFWVDTSDWTAGDTVIINSNLYSILRQSGAWQLHRSLGDYQSENLYYHGVLGIFTGSYTDWMSLSSFGFSGYTIDIEIQQSNIDGFVTRVTGSNVVVEIVLLTFIFTEILIIQGLWKRRRSSTSPVSESGG